MNNLEEVIAFKASKLDTYDFQFKHYYRHSEIKFHKVEKRDNN